MTNDERKDYEEAQRLIAEAKANRATELELSRLRSLTTLPPELAQLTALTELDVSETQITDLTPLAQLTALTSLNVGGTQITDLAPLAHLTALTSLECWSPQVTDLTPLARLTALTSLNALGTQITDLTPLAQLTALTELALDGCTALTRLALPEAMLERLVFLYIYGCPLTDLPRELCQRGIFVNVAREVHAYVRGLREQGSAVLNECKLIVLGNGRAGKTSAIKALQGDLFDPDEQSTHAIRFWRWTRALAFAPGSPAEQARVNVWDFGGQDIYHQAHRLFLRTRAVFLVCWNPWEQTAALREDGDEPRALTYWLEQIHALHPSPRILILRTHADCDAAELAARRCAQVPDWRGTVPEKYRHLPSMALGAAAPDAATVAEIHAQLDTAFAAEMSAGSRAVPAGWAAVRTRLEALSAENEAAFRNNERPPHAVLSEQEFATLVEESLAPTVIARDPAEARAFLHDIGALFYDERLGGRVVLDQRWAIEGIYAVLRPSPFRQWLEEGGGTFTAHELAPQWSRVGYTQGEQELLLEFMQACGQAAEIMRAEETANGEEVYLAPSLLPKYSEETVEAWPAPPGNPIFQRGYVGPRLGAEVAQAFIVAVAKEFLRSGRYWRWGAEITSKKLGATARVEWNPHTLDSYGGEISITTWGERGAAGQLDRAVRDCILAFVPDGTAITGVTAGPFIGSQPIVWPTVQRPKPDSADPDAQRQERPASKAHPMEAVADDRATAQGRYLSFSIAGENSEHPGIEAAPLALYEALIPKAEQRGWKAFLYKRSTDQPDVRQLLRHVGAGDYVVVFLSKKYLISEYCMEELRRVYEAEPKGQFPPETARIFGFPGWRPADYREWMSLFDKWRAALEKKQSEWAERCRKLFPDFEKAKGIVEKEPAYGWFCLCFDEAQLATFQREMENYGATDAPLHFSPTKPSDREWLEKWTEEILGRLK